MGEAFSLEAYKGFDGTVGIRVLVKSSGWGSGPSATMKVLGNLTPEVALAFAKNLESIAGEVAQRNAKKDAEDQRRQERLAKLPRISLR